MTGQIPFSDRKSKFSALISFGVFFSLSAIAFVSWQWVCIQRRSPFEHFQFFCFLALFALLFYLIHPITSFLMGLSAKRRMLWLLMIGLAVRVIWVFGVKNELVSDSAIYQELAKALISGKGYAITGPVGIEDTYFYLDPFHRLPYTTAYRAPGTSLWAALLYLIFGPRPGVFKIFNIALSLATAFLLAGVFFPRKDSGTGTKITLLWMLYPSSIVAVNLVGSETLFTFLLVLAAWLFSRTDFSRCPYLFVAAAGIVSALALLVRPILAIFLGAAVISFGARLSFPSAAKRTACFFLFFVVSLAPWTIRNYRAFHQFIPVCTDEGEFLGRHTYFNIPVRELSPDVVQEYVTWIRLDNEVEKSRQGYHLAFKNMKKMFLAGPGHVARCLLENTKSAFSSDIGILNWSVMRSFGLARQAGPLNALNDMQLTQAIACVMAFYLLLVSTAFLGSWRFNQNLLSFTGGMFLLLFYLASFCALAMIRGLERYHFSMMPIITVLAAFHHEDLIKHIQSIMDKLGARKKIPMVTSHGVAVSTTDSDYLGLSVFVTGSNQ